MSEAAPYLYRYAHVRSRTDSPSVASLEAEGWTVEHVDPRYGTALMMREEPARQSTDEDEAAELVL